MRKEFIKILQFSDLHFDTPFLGLSLEESELRKEELRESFSRIVEIAKEKEVDIMLIAGDLFDNKRVSKITIDFIVEKIRIIPEIRIFISPGNHDPYDNNSFYNIIKWPENVYVFKNKIEKVYIDALKTCVYGVGFEKSHIESPLLKGFSLAENEERFNIMVLHGDVISKGDSSIYNPIYLEDIKNSNLDYLAIGHKHSYSFDRIGKTYYCYSGNPEGRSFNESGDKGIVYIKLHKDFCEKEFIITSKRRYLTIGLDISDCNNYEKIKDKVLCEVDEEIRKKDIVKIILTGNISKDFLINIKMLKKKIEQYFHYVDIVDETTINILENEFIEGSLRQIYSKALREKISQADGDEEKAILEDALIFGLKALMDMEV